MEGENAVIEGEGLYNIPWEGKEYIMYLPCEGKGYIIYHRRGRGI